MNRSQEGTQIRYPSVANLMIDSADRKDAYPSPWDFVISKNQSLFNGFFTRIGATEVVLEWQNPNIITGVNSTLTFLITGITGAINVNIGGGNSVFSTVGDILDTITAAFNTAAGSTTAPFRFNVVNNAGDVGILDSSGAAIVITPTVLSAQLNLQGGSSSFIYPAAPDLRPYRYLDFVSNQLTYNQSLKDATSNLRDQSVLLRWYFAFDNPTPSDQHGFPVLMGYQPFILRRLYNPPKQIAWESNMPIGQVGFQVFGNDGNLVSNFLNLSNWLMTLQISEN
jgi:hypothetical protein